MSSTDGDLKSHATSNAHDFYALLDISPAATESEIRRAYRRTALKYHPDKITNPTQPDIDKFHLLQIANDVLSEPAVRQLYDNAREARERKKREHDMLDAAKRRMKEDLEARERAGAAAAGVGGQRGVKRAWGATVAGDDTEEKLAREIERIAEDGRRRRREAEEKLKREVEADEERIRAEEAKQQERHRSSKRVDRSHEGGTNVPEQERAVKVRWVREGRGTDLDKDRLTALFAPFGKIESVLVLKDRRQRLNEGDKKKTVATGLIVFASIVAAHTAVLDSEKFMRESLSKTANDWNVIDSVFWATGEQPYLAGRISGGDSGSASPSTSHGQAPSPKEQEQSAPAPPKPTFSFAGLKNAGGSGSQPGKAPSFGSFASAATGGAKAAPGTAAESNGAKTPSLEEITLMRLKNAQREKERRALEEQLRKEDEAADAAETAGN
ncbi:putative cell cycle control protein (Cwf23) [Aspergillus undulatus]|uniref:putative cell cycle control protein (Cwf23) n=1 Tax=Aspergillus undulatus TaxID=1810928 RepID=UPI003CCD8482